MKFRDIVIGAIVLGILVGGALWIRKARLDKQALTVTTPTTEEKISDTFNGLTIPEGTQKAELRDVSGGNGFGIATRTEVLADLPEPPSGKVYQVRIEKGDQKVLLGTMRVAKGGYMLEYDSSKYPGYERVVVFSGEERILEGSF